MDYIFYEGFPSITPETLADTYQVSDTNERVFVNPDYIFFQDHTIAYSYVTYQIPSTIKPRTSGFICGG